MPNRRFSWTRRRAYSASRGYGFLVTTRVCGGHSERLLTERADLKREMAKLSANETAGKQGLAAIYVERGLKPELAKQVARQLMSRDALSPHARDEIGIFSTLSARPIQAAFASASVADLGIPSSR